MKFRTKIWRITRDRLALIIPKEYENEFADDTEKAIYEITVEKIPLKEAR